LMHCWNILKDEPKWMDLKRKIDKIADNAGEVPVPHGSNTVDLDPGEASPGSSTEKCPMGRDAAKAARKKAASTSASSSEYASKMQVLSIQKMSFFKETEEDRKSSLEEMLNLEKVKVEEAREHRRTLVQLERERLDMDKKRLVMKAQK
ncbi:hypothetical protein BAE44_0021880, partial [Dichanthelium oligosanthes]